MDWKEYQYITAELLERAERIGKIDKNVLLPDKSSGRKRQIDALLEVKTKGRIIKIVIDAKYRKRKINVNDVGIVSELIDAVGADRGVIICPNGWSSYAKDRSKELGLDLKLVTIEDAIEFFNPGKWKLCPICEDDYIILDIIGGIDYLETEDVEAAWIAGQCRECGSATVSCQFCGDELDIPYHKAMECHCGNVWKVGHDGISLEIPGLLGEMPIK
jgi:hypothetical protein